MIRSEFKQWADDLAARLPESGAYIANQTQATRDSWYTEIFARLQLNDCIEANRQIQREGVPAYDREQIPVRVSVIAGRLSWERTEQARREAERAQHRISQNGVQVEHFTGGMVQATKAIERLKRERQCTWDEIPRDERMAIIDEYV